MSLITVGVSDGHLGSGYGIHPSSTDNEINAIAAEFANAVTTTEISESHV